MYVAVTVATPMPQVAMHVDVHVAMRVAMRACRPSEHPSTKRCCKETLKLLNLSCSSRRIMPVDVNVPQKLQTHLAIITG